MTEKQKVLLEVSKAGAVSVQVLTRTAEGWAVSGRSPFEHLGMVQEFRRPVVVRNANRMQSYWRWSSEGYYGEAPSQQAAVTAMLASCDYEATTLADITPPLF